jgi:hypothetical protein
MDHHLTRAILTTTRALSNAERLELWKGKTRPGHVVTNPVFQSAPTHKHQYASTPSPRDAMVRARFVLPLI